MMSKTGCIHHFLGGCMRVQPDRILLMKSLILAQNERWRRGLGMQVARERGNPSTAA